MTAASSRESSRKLTVEGDKLSGAYIGRDGQETPIQEGKVKGDEISFQVPRERDGQKFIIKFQGKLARDSLKGKLEFEAGGETRSLEMEAKRVKEAK